MDYDVIIIGAGISGLTAGSLLAKRGLSVAVVDRNYSPGGSCGIFKRNGVTFDQGAAMLYGFGDKGFNPHRFVFDSLEEPIDVIRHDALYCVNYMGRRIKFWPDVDRFARDLGDIFPSERESIIRFYGDMMRMYTHVMVENPVFAPPDEPDVFRSLRNFARHPLSHVRFLGFLNMSAREMLDGYFKDPEIFKFFDKLTSTYCYTTVEETPAVLAAVMFVDNHVGGSFYPAGSSAFLPGRLEKSIEDNGGAMVMGKEVVSVVFDGGRPSGVALDSGEVLHADEIIYSGSVWSFYGGLVDRSLVAGERLEWAEKLVPTYPSVVLYAHVRGDVIPEGTLPVEMLVGNPDSIDEEEVTAYILSLDDRTLCPEGTHVVVAIGPSLVGWKGMSDDEYASAKDREKERLVGVLENRFPGFSSAVIYSEIASPRTIERYTGKKGGAVAGPKQMIGQHMLSRLHTRSEWDNLFFCGESTVMGTGTPAVTVSGIGAANAVLGKKELKQFKHSRRMKSFVREVPKPFTLDMLYGVYGESDREAALEAARCQLCEHPRCMEATSLDIRGIMRRAYVGNFNGAARLASMMDSSPGMAEPGELARSEEMCVMNSSAGGPVAIRRVIRLLGDRTEGTVKTERSYGI